MSSQEVKSNNNKHDTNGLRNGSLHSLDGTHSNGVVHSYKDERCTSMGDIYDNVWRHEEHLRISSDANIKDSQIVEYDGVKLSPDLSRCRKPYATLRWFCCGTKVRSLFLENHVKNNVDVRMVNVVDYHDNMASFLKTNLNPWSQGK